MSKQTETTKNDLILQLVNALEPFAQFACNEPHVNEPMCYNCIARSVIEKAKEFTK